MFILKSFGNYFMSLPYIYIILAKPFEWEVIKNLTDIIMCCLCFNSIAGQTTYTRSKSAKKAPEECVKCVQSSASIFNFEQISQTFLLFPLLILQKNLVICWYRTCNSYHRFDSKIGEKIKIQSSNNLPSF